MSSFVKITIVGRLGRNPELRSNARGKSVANYSVAVTETYTKDGEKFEQTDWYSISSVAGQAEADAKYLKKGSLVMIHGKPKFNQGDDGKSYLNIYAEEVVYLSQKPKQRDHADGEFDGGFQ
jgi:single-strand DNA-binding protein